MSVAELRPAAAPGAIPTAEELVARARALAPKLRERAVRAERDRNIPQASVDEFIEAGRNVTQHRIQWRFRRIMRRDAKISERKKRG